MSNSKRFGLMIWGLLFTLVDININNFDFLPDPVGYIMIAIACAGLMEISRHFSTTGKLSLLLVPLCLLNYLNQPGEVNYCSYIPALVDIVMMWFLLAAMIEAAASKEQMDIAQRAEKLRTLYILLMGVGHLLVYLVLDHPKPAFAVTIILLVLIIVLLYHILRMIAKVQEQFERDERRYT